MCLVQEQLFPGWTAMLFLSSLSPHNPVVRATSAFREVALPCGTSRRLCSGKGPSPQHHQHSLLHLRICSCLMGPELCAPGSFKEPALCVQGCPAPPCAGSCRLWSCPPSGGHNISWLLHHFLRTASKAMALTSRKDGPLRCMVRGARTEAIQRLWLKFLLT